MARRPNVPPPPSFSPVARTRAADSIFEEMASAILRGEYEDGSALPPERVLAERFEVSRGTVRHAIHRLAEAGLVRARQGGATTVIASRVTMDMRVMELRYRLGPQSSAEAEEVSEVRLLEGFALTFLVSRRARAEELTPLLAIVEQAVREDTSESDVRACENAVWMELARLTQNSLFEGDVARFVRLTEQNQRPAPNELPPSVRIAALRELLGRLIEGRDPLGYYLSLLDLAIPPRRASPKET